VHDSLGSLAGAVLLGLGFGPVGAFLLFVGGSRERWVLWRAAIVSMAGIEAQTLGITKGLLVTAWTVVSVAAGQPTVLR